MHAPSISILTVTRGRRELLAEKLASLTRQTLPPSRFEWVVCLRGDIDGSEELLKRAELPFHLEVFTAAADLAAGPARNACAARARGEVLYLSDDDCLLLPETLERHLQAQLRRPAAYLGQVQFEMGATVRRWLPRPRYWQLNGANTSVPAAAFAAVGGFDAELDGYGGEDLLLGYRLARYDLSFRVLPTAVVRHRGPNPRWGRDLAKARSAGRNAARIARKHPELAFRLGVHPLLLGAKGVLLAPPCRRILDRISAGAVAYEDAYYRGAREEFGRAPPAAQEKTQEDLDG